MRVCDLGPCAIPREKLCDYLLSNTYLDGRHKAAFFTRFGFDAQEWEALREALLRHAKQHDIRFEQESPFGTRYVVEGAMSSPDGRDPIIRAVWFIDSGQTTPRFVTAYPIREQTNG